MGNPRGLRLDFGESIARRLAQKKKMEDDERRVMSTFYWRYGGAGRRIGGAPSAGKEDW